MVVSRLSSIDLFRANDEQNIRYIDPAIHSSIGFQRGFTEQNEGVLLLTYNHKTLVIILTQMEIIQTIQTLRVIQFCRDNAINGNQQQQIDSVLMTNILNNEGNSLKMIWSGEIDFLANES